MKEKFKNKYFIIIFISILYMILCIGFVNAKTINISDFIEDKEVNIKDISIEKERRRKYGIVAENDGKYIYDENGNLLINYLYKTKKGNIYYSDENGKCVMGTWLVVSPASINTNINFSDTKTRTLYFSNNGTAFKGVSRSIDGERYTFDNDGYLSDDDKFEKMGIKNDENIFKVLAEKKVGDIVYFGEYAQTSEKEEKIIWKILEKTNDKVLLISNYILDCKNFDDDGKNVWESSSIRNWLNNTFIYWVFKEDEELDSIVASNVVTNGNTTVDRIFLLASDEIIRYFGKEDEKGMNKKSATMATNKARENKIFVSENKNEWYNNNSSYYLRDMGTNFGNVKCVGVYGHLYDEGEEAKLENGDGIRPAMWVKYK